MGGTSHGTGGTNSMSLSSSNLPNHSHSMNHRHTAGNTENSGQHQHYSTFRYTRMYYTGSSISHNVLMHSGTEAGSSSINTTITGEHRHSFTVPMYIGNTGSMSGTSGRSFNNRPKYFKVKYYIRFN